MQKTIFLLLFAFVYSGIYAQAPQKFRYRCVIRDTLGNIVPDQKVGIQICILEGSSSGHVRYSESQKATTNSFGLVDLEVGSGNVISGSLKSLKWCRKTYFIKIETDLSGGFKYALSQASQLLNIVYALQAENYSMTSNLKVDSLFSFNSACNVIPSGDTSGGKDLQNIQNAVNSNNVTTLAPGTYYVNGTINIASSNKVIRGITDPSATCIKQVFSEVIKGVIINTVNYSGLTNIYIENIKFESSLGKVAYDTSFLYNNYAIVLFRTSKSTVKNCCFAGFRSSALDINDSRFAPEMGEQNNFITGNRFENCWMGVSIWFNTEFGILNDNFFTRCRTAIMNNSGNWMISDNSISYCRAAIIQTNLDGEINGGTGGNFAHGNVVGNIMAHCDSNTWTHAPKMHFGGFSFDPQGIWIYGAIDPSAFYSNVINYTDITVTNTSHRVPLDALKISHSTIKADNAVIDLSGFEKDVSVTLKQVNGGIINQ
jgi:hypothetical protein